MYKKLRDLRVNSGYTVQRMAEILEISKAYYWQIENNKRNLSYRLAIRIGNAFKMKPDEIFYDDFINTK